MKYSSLILSIQADRKEVLASKSPLKNFIVRAYDAVVGKIQNYMKKHNKLDQDRVYNTDIDSADLEITNKMRERLREKISQHNMESNSSSKIDTLRNELMEISGIGAEKALELISAGVRSVADLKKKNIQPLLSLETRTFVRYEPVIAIPRAYIEYIEAFLQMYVKPKTVIAGSYRRKLDVSSDVDVIVTDTSKLGADDFWDGIAAGLRDAGCDYHEFMRGPDKTAVVFKPGRDKILLKEYPVKTLTYVKLDIMRTTPSQYGCMLAYLTGSREFNISMRAKAKSLGYMLNQKSLSKNGVVVPVKSERDLFKILKMTWVQPENRS